jgi:hypothetical protein
MEQVALVATERALRTYDAKKGTLQTWIRLLVERYLAFLREDVLPTAERLTS